MLEISDLVHSFGERVAVDHLTVGIGQREIVGLVGRNGAGKTTAMRAVMGIVRPSGGEIRWEGHPVGQADRLRFGYMPEERGLYPQMPVVDQLVYFARLHGQDKVTAREQARHWVERLGLGPRRHERVIALSHGNQQRVQLAVALVSDPELLVLDEPFAGLDPAAVDTLSGILRDRACDGAAVLFSSHQLELVEQICDRIVILDEGRVLASGSLAELQARLPRRLRVQAAEPARWATQVPGATILEDDGPDGTVLGLEPGTDPQAILHAALAFGPVCYFGFESSRLSDLYRKLVVPS